MQFSTQIPLKKQQRNLIDYHSNVLMLGSCFSENIGTKFQYSKFQNTINPFGILFHPKAIENLILNAINKKVYTEEDLFFNNEQWHCFEAHSKLSNPSKEIVLQQLNASILLMNKQLHKATHIIITLGTAWCYRFIETDKTVANCHKIPQKKFLKEILSVKEISESLASIVTLIKSFNKEVSILFTASPVRHLKDGFIENQQSKSHLIAAIHSIIKEYNVSYFPAYEIVMDELRNYRFYAGDMIHPNQTAIDYIWDKFTEVWMSDKTVHLIEKVNSIQKKIAHKPFNSNSKQHQKFLDYLESEIKELQIQFPEIRF